MFRIQPIQMSQESKIETNPRGLRLQTYIAGLLIIFIATKPKIYFKNRATLSEMRSVKIIPEWAEDNDF